MTTSLISLAYEIACINVSNRSLDIAYSCALAQREKCYTMRNGIGELYILHNEQCTCYAGITDDCYDEDLECPACLSAYRNCECGVLRVCPDCGDFLDYGCQCNEAQEEFEAEMRSNDPDLCQDCGEYDCECDPDDGWSRSPRHERRTRASRW